MSAFARARDAAFPHALPEGAFVKRTVELLAPLGFTEANSIACVGVCRDEICRPLRARIQEGWGEAFDFAGLGGMLFLGRTGMGAAHAHAPIEGGKARTVYFALPHIAIDEAGTLGKCARTGRPGPSSACGALVAFFGELQREEVKLVFDPDDIEQTLLKQKLMEAVAHDHPPSIAELTDAAHQVICADLERMIAQTLHPDRDDYAVFTGIQIHGPTQGWVQPRAAYAVVDGVRTDLKI